jgi:hypothetical protein
VPEVLELAALERRTRERLDTAAYDFFAGGAEDELTLAANRGERRIHATDAT